MKNEDFEKELNLKYRPVGVTLADECDSNCKQDFPHCVLTALNAAANGQKVAIHCNMLKCNGAHKGCGFTDGVPNIPGGFGNFISMGAGEGFPQGERLKKTPQLGEEMMTSQPQNVLDEHKYLILEPFEEGNEPNIVIILANCDQFSALTYLFNFEKGGYDTVIAPASSGCASVFRIPLGESKNESPRAVLGNLDIFSRPHFKKDIVSFTVSFKDYKKMLENADECFFRTNSWKKIKDRL